ncbi:MAG: hypothetical protein CSA76_06470, partial [Spirochaetales bacterium]
MPSREVLDALKTQINALGNEPRLLAERGEKLEDVLPPETTNIPDIEDMLARGAEGVSEMDAFLSSHAENSPDISDIDETVNLENPNEMDDWDDTDIAGEIDET